MWYKRNEPKAPPESTQGIASQRSDETKTVNGVEPELEETTRIAGHYSLDKFDDSWSALI